MILSSNRIATLLDRYHMQNLLISVSIVIASAVLWSFIFYRKGLVANKSKTPSLEQSYSFIKSYQFPSSIKSKIKLKFPHLNQQQIESAFDNLRIFFQIVRLANGKTVAMPSRLVDEIWHEFIINTQCYQEFCDGAFGRYLNHRPDSDNELSNSSSRKNLQRSWQLAKEIQFPSSANSMPTLFLIDQLFHIDGGMNYSKSDLEEFKRLSNSSCDSSIYKGAGNSVSKECDADTWSSQSSASSNNCSSCSSGCGGD